MWSYPIIRKGLIYVIDIRNGLYILRYTGPRWQEAAFIYFLAGNSNLGDAVLLSKFPTGSRIAAGQGEYRPCPAARGGTRFAGTGHLGSVTAGAPR